MCYSDAHIGGTLVWYYYVCRRQVWLMARQITPDEDDTNIVLGRFYAEKAYARDKKEIAFGHMKFDIVRHERDGLVVGEVKKSSKHAKSARMQLAFYLWELRKQGIAARGRLLFPREKKQESIILNDDLVARLEKVKKDIVRIIASPAPPGVQRKAICSNCAYAEFCWS